MRLQSTGFVYFITNGDAIKVGFAIDVAKRMKALQVSHHAALCLLGSFKANPRKEREFHERLKDHRLVGEWFEIQAAINLIIELETKQGWIEGESEDDYAIKAHNMCRGRTEPPLLTADG